MKKKILSAMSLVVVSSMIMTSITGCSTTAKATDQEVTMKEETIIVTDNESSEDAVISTEDEITETEVVGEVEDNEAKNEDVNYTEHEFFFVLDKLDLSTAEDIDMNALKPDGNDYELNESVTLYGSGRGAIIGYTKPNITVHVVTSNEDWYCLYFADEEPAYQNILVKAEDFIASAGVEVKEKVLITLEDVKKVFIEEIYKWGDSTEEFYKSELGYDDDFELNFELLDSVSSDMESIEFKVPMYYSDSDTLQLDSWIAQMQAENDLASYSKFYIEPVEDEFDEEYLWFRVYYKDLQESAK